MKRNLLAATLVLAATVMACKQGDQPTAGNAPTAAPSASSGGAAQTGTDLVPDADHKVVEVDLITAPDGTNRFVPSEVMANRGDVLRFTLKVGVHNVDFFADSNRGKTGLPAAPSDPLQLPGQTYDVKVSFAAGMYYFQCDPHALLGMHGHLMVH